MYHTHLYAHITYAENQYTQPRYRCIMTIYAYVVSRKTYLPSAYASWIICWIFVERGGTTRIFRARMEFFRRVQKAEAGLKKSHSRLKIHRGRRGCWTSEKVPSTETAKNIYRQRVYMYRSTFFCSGILTKILAKCVNNDTVINATFSFPIINLGREKVSTCLAKSRYYLFFLTKYTILWC